MMRHAVWMGLAVLLAVVSMVQGETSTAWNPPASAGSTTALWTDAANWSGTVPVGGPNGDYKVQFYNGGRRDCILNQTRMINHLVMGDGGSGVHVLRLASGGHLTAGIRPDDGRVWTGIGWGSNATLIVEEGASLTTGDHLWVGHINNCIGTVRIDGGTVNVAQMFGLNWDNRANASGRVIVKAGVLNLANWHSVQSIRTHSYLEVSGGRVYISGDRISAIQPMIADGRIRAYEGLGKVVYDYNVTSPGKTTITGMPPVEGDLNNDFGVDIADLAILADDWLSYNCASVANFDGGCRVDLRDFSVLAAHWLGGIVTQWHIAETRFPTEDMIVTPHYAEGFGIVADGTTDVTEAIQKALISVSNLGGGTLFLPAGFYRVDGILTIPSGVTLRGDWTRPLAGQPVEGTVLMAYAGRGDESGAPFIGLGNSAGVKGLTIWYPEQLPTDIQPYSPAIQRTSGSNAAVENVTFVNAYIGFTTYNNSITAGPFVRNVFGTPLKTGIEFDCLADIGRIETVHFSPAYWKDSGLPNAPTNNEHAAWLYSNGTGIILRRIDWSFSNYVTIEGYKTGLLLAPSRHDTSEPNGQSYAFTLRNCKTGIEITKNSYAGYLFTRFVIENAETGIYFGTAANQTATFHSCTVDASNYAVHNVGTQRVLMQHCDFQRGKVLANGGYLSIVDSEFPDVNPQITLYSGVRGASILSNRFAGSIRIQNATSYPVVIDHTQRVFAPLPAYDFKTPEQAFKPAKADLFVVTQPPFNAQADGVTDDTAAFQAALDAAQANGGGIVFVPGGHYRLNGNLTVAGGVELRGIFDIPHSTSALGSVLNVCAGRGQADGTPFLQVESNGGVRGLTFHYPEQIYDAADTVNYGMAPYPFLIRGLGSDIYVINLASTIPYQLLDLATYRCDRHYVNSILSTALLTGVHIGGGTTDGLLFNCQFNPSLFTHQGGVYESIPYNTADGIHAILWRQSRPYLFGHMTGQVLHQNFVFGGLYGFHYVKEGDFGPSGYSLGSGIDQCTTALRVDHIGQFGLDMINTQLVTVDATNGRYVEVGATFADTFRMFNTASWGTNNRSVVVGGGFLDLQLFHVAKNAVAAAFDVRNQARLRSVSGNQGDRVSTFLVVQPTAQAEFIGNVLNTTSSQMPQNTSNVTSIGNLRVQ